MTTKKATIVVSGGTSGATYKSGQAAWYAASIAATARSAATLPGVIFVEGWSNGDTGQSDATVNVIRKAQVDGVAETTGLVIGGYRSDLPLTDSVHNDETGRIELGRRIGRAIASALGLSATNARGPSLAAGSTWSGSTITLPVTLNGATTISVPATPTGFVVTANGSPVAVTGGSYTGGNLVLTCASALAAPVTIAHLMGTTPTITSLVRGDVSASSSSPAALPLAVTTDEIAVATGDVAASGAIGTINLSSPSGMVAAGASAKGNIGTITLAAVDGTATGGALAPGSLATVTITPPAGTVTITTISIPVRLTAEIPARVLIGRV
jgi:hypothetical protein